MTKLLLCFTQLNIVVNGSTSVYTVDVYIMWAVIHSPGLMVLVETKLLLLCANTENTQDLKALVGKVGQENASKAQIEPTDWIPPYKEPQHVATY